MDLKLGTVEAIPVRQVWNNEPLVFSPWLRDHLDELSAVLGMNLSDGNCEESTGSFSVDIVATDDDGNVVVIENQLERSDHDHLGKVLTYLASTDAKTAVWITPEPRHEHINAVNWLNESGLADFYLIKLEAICIGDSLPAPLFTRIVGPSEVTEKSGDVKRENREQREVLRRFWKALLDCADTKTDLLSNSEPTGTYYMSFRAKKRYLFYSFTVAMHRVKVEFLIDRRNDEGEFNEKVLSQLKQSKDQIESEFGESLEWCSWEQYMIRKIRKVYEDGGYLDEEKWPQIHETMIDAMIRLERTLSPYIARLDA